MLRVLDNQKDQKPKTIDMVRDFCLPYSIWF